MYQRQWFPPDSQEGLSAQSLEIEHDVRQKNYAFALTKISHCIKRSNTQFQRYYWNRQFSRVIALKEFCESNKSYISLSFEDFWPGFNPSDNEIVNLLKICCNKIGLKIQLDQVNPDLVLTSCFSSKSILPRDNATRILYLGENVRPIFSVNDYSLTFDLDNYMGRNIYLPLWFLRGTEFAAYERDYDPYDIRKLSRSINSSANRKNKVVYIGNNMTPLRKSFIELLRKNNVEVDIFGSQTGNPVDNKINKMREYRYSLCFENSFHPGYITEKLLDGYSAGTVPVYWGGITNTLFNSEKFIYHSSEASMQQTIEKLMKFESNSTQGLIFQDCYEALHQRIIYSLTRLLFDLFVR